MNRLGSCVVLLLAVALVGFAHGQVKNPEDFESYTVGQQLTSADGWSGGESAPHSIVAGQALEIEDEFDLNSDMVWEQPVLSGLQRLRYDVKLTDRYGTAVARSLVNPTSGSVATFIAESKDTGLNLLIWNDGYTSVNLLGAMNLDTWYTVEVEFDTTSDTASGRAALQGAALGSFSSSLPFNVDPTDDDIRFLANDVVSHDNISLEPCVVFDPNDPRCDVTEFTWRVNSGGEWLNAANWDPAGFPDGVDKTAIFGPAITTSRTVFTDADVVVNRIEFNDDDTYNIAGNGSVILSGDVVPTVVPSISVLDGLHQFQADVVLQHDTMADVAADATLVFNNTLDLGGNTLTTTGSGTVAIRNDLVTGGGTVSIQAGTVSGNGTVGGDVNNDGGTISPGNSPGVLEIEGQYAQGADGSARDVSALYEDGNLSVVPEPATLVLLVGMLVLSCYRRARSRLG